MACNQFPIDLLLKIGNARNPLRRRGTSFQGGKIFTEVLTSWRSPPWMKIANFVTFEPKPKLFSEKFAKGNKELTLCMPSRNTGIMGLLLRGRSVCLYRLAVKWDIHSVQNGRARVGLLYHGS